MVTQKTESGESSKSTSSASTSNLDTASHLNQGKLSTTHNALAMQTLEQEKQSEETKESIHQGGSSVCDDNDAKSDKKTETESGESDARRLNVASTHVSHDTSGTGNINHMDTSEGADVVSDVKQSIMGMPHNLPVQYEDENQTSRVDKGEKSTTQSSFKRISSSENNQTLPKSKTAHANNVSSKDSQSTDRSYQESSLANPAGSSETTTYQKDKPSTSTKQKLCVNSQDTMFSVKKKQTSIMDLFKTKPKESKMSTPPNRHKVKSGSKQKQKVARKVLVPETPDRNGDEGDDNLDCRKGDDNIGCQEDECKGSQESNSSLFSETSSDLEGYTDVITASVEKLKHRLQTRKENDEDSSTDETGVRKEKKFERKPALDGGDVSHM